MLNWNIRISSLDLESSSFLGFKESSLSPYLNMYTHVKAATISHQWRQLLEAIQHDDLNIVSAILNTSGWPTDASFTDYETLVAAIKSGHKRIAHFLLDKNCQVFRGTGINTPMHYAVQQHNWDDLIKRLLDKGCRVSDANHSGKTAVHVAYKGKATGKAIDFLLQQYVLTSSVNVVSNEGLSTLHIACTRSDPRIVERLLESDKHLINQTIHGSLSTPLHYAVNNRRHDVARLLLDRGADLYQRDAEGSTPLHWALWTRDVQMIDMILGYDTRKDNVVNRFGLSHFMVSCAGTNPDAVHEFVNVARISKSISPQGLMATKIKKLGSYSDYTPLHFAVEFGSSVKIVKLLLKFGADCCASTCHELTPHSVAFMKGHKEISRVLQEHCPSRKKDLEEL